jgi:hypothetical protein
MAYKSPYKGLVGLPIKQYSMDNPGVVAAVDGLLKLIKDRTEKGYESWVPRLSTITGLSQSQVRTLLRLARESKRATQLWGVEEGYTCNFDMSRGHRVYNRNDDKVRKQAAGVIKTSATRLHREVTPLGDVKYATDIERAVARMAENQIENLNIMRSILENQTPPEITVA